MIKNFKELEIWQIGKEIAKDIYTLTNKYPNQEMYGMISQMRRSALSIPLNIAEGFNRFHKAEFRRFLFISLGSCAELETQIIISKELGFISEDEFDQFNNKIERISKMIRSLSNKLSTKYQEPTTRNQEPLKLLETKNEKNPHLRRRRRHTRIPQTDLKRPF